MATQMGAYCCSWVLKAGLRVAVFSHMAWERAGLGKRHPAAPVLVLVCGRIMVFEADYTHLIKCSYLRVTT